MKHIVKYILNRATFMFLFVLAKTIKLRQKKNNHKVVWFGAYGNSNKGDDLIFWGLKKYIPNDYEISLSCRDVSFKDEYGIRTFKKGENVYSLYRNVGEIVKSSVFVLGGGGLFESYDDSEDSRRLKLAYIAPFLIARICGLKTLVLGIGCNKARSSSRLLEKALAFVYTHSDIIVTRDAKSLNGLAICANSVNSNAHWTFDPVFTLPTKKIPKEKNVSFLLWPYFLWPEFYTLKALHNLNKQKKEKHALFLAKIKKAIGFVRSRGYLPVFPEFHFSDKMLVEDLGEEIYPCDRGEYMELIGKSALVVTMRYHGQITSLLNRTPFISLVVQEKMSALVQNMAVEQFSFSDISEFDERIFEKMMDNALAFDWTQKFELFESYKKQAHSLYMDNVYTYLDNI